MTGRSNPLYLLDANVFIEAHQRYYTFDICPGFWEWLSHRSTRSDIVSIDRVKTELVGYGDALSDWVKSAPTDLFAQTGDQNVLDSYRQVMEWVDQNPQFQPQAKSKFASGADGWLIAYARVHGNVLVTHEAYSPDAENRVPIPNVCEEFRVCYMDTFEMLRQLQVRFNWNASTP